jgi:hypothetical protein
VKRFVSLLVALLSLGLAAAWATTYAELGLETMLQRGDLAFYATVSEVRVEMREDETWTVVVFEVREAMRGEVGEELSLSFYGGEPVIVTGMPRFAPGEVVFVLAYNAPYYSPIVGFNQGLWRLGPRGFEDERGRLLSLGEAGELVLEGEGAADEEILTALRQALGGPQ